MTRQKPSFAIFSTSSQISIAFADRVEYGVPRYPRPYGSRSSHSNRRSLAANDSYRMAARKSCRMLSCRPAAALKVIDQLTEYPGTGPGSLSFKIPHSHWRVETTSGATTASEWTLQIIQTMDESEQPPLAVTSLTTTNANVSQVGASYVIGAVKGRRHRRSTSPIGIRERRHTSSWASRQELHITLSTPAAPSRSARPQEPEI